MTKIHLDTDIGGDMDDLCALAMLLKWPDLEITGVTSVSDEQGRRAGYVQYVLSLVGRTDVPCAAGFTSPSVPAAAHEDDRSGGHTGRFVVNGMKNDRLAVNRDRVKHDWRRTDRLG